MLWTIFIVHLVGLISPGPDFFYISRKAMGDSRRNALLGSIGIALGVGFWAVLVLFGLTFLNRTLPTFQYYLMLLGGAYLAYCGLKMVRVTRNATFEGSPEALVKTSAVKEILNGLAINLSNPKVVVFFSSVLASYMSNLSQLSDLFLVLAMLIISTAGYFATVSVLLSHRHIRQFYAKHNRYLDNFAGVIFILFGTKLMYGGACVLLG